jgi:hypothetical protein
VEPTKPKLRTLDFWATPPAAVNKEFINALPRKFTFVEPCAGAGFLADAIEARSGGRCVGHYDLYDERQVDARTADSTTYNGSHFFITNPPFATWMLHPIIDNLRVQRTTWMLLPADFMHRRKNAVILDYCDLIISCGQVSWFGGSKGYKNFAWYRFNRLQAADLRFIPLERTRA